MTTKRELANAIERRYTELCRELTSAGHTDPNEIAGRALRQAVREHADQLANHPGIAQQYAADLLRAEAEGEVPS